MNKTLKPYFEKARRLYELKELERLGLTPDMDQRSAILNYIALLLKWNAATGLISVKDEGNLFIRHFCDSLQPLLLFGFKKNAKVLDIGAGGGFPSVPISIFRPDLKFLLAESNRKKSSFLREVKNSLSMENLEVFSGRSDRIPHIGTKFDYVMSRGVGTLKKFSKLAKPFVATDGRMYTFKTKQFASELEEITNSKEKDRVCISEIAEYDLANQITGLNLVSLAVI